jgi:hypothetical protein
MDDTRGNFKPITLQKFEEQMEKPGPLVFRKGEIIEVRGSRLRIEKIYKNKIIFKLLPKF